MYYKSYIQKSWGFYSTNKHNVFKERYWCPLMLWTGKGVGSKWIILTGWKNVSSVGWQLLSMWVLTVSNILAVNCLMLAIRFAIFFNENSPTDVATAKQFHVMSKLLYYQVKTEKEDWPLLFLYSKKDYWISYQYM